MAASFNDNEVINHRSVPQAWPTLMELANNAGLIEGRWYPDDEVKAVAVELSTLDREPLDAVLFYASSLGICEVARELQDDEARADIIEKGSKAILKVGGKDSGGLSALTYPPLAVTSMLEPAFEPLVRRAYERMSPQAKLLGDLAAADRHDRMDGTYSYYSKSSDAAFSHSWNAILRLNRTKRPGSAERLSPLVECAIVSNISNSAAWITRQILEHHTVGLSFGQLPAREVLDFLKDTTVTKVAERACYVTSTEFFDTTDPILDIGFGKREIKFKKPKGDRPLPEGESPYTHRQKPLVCPAAQVPEMVAMSMDLVTSMVDRAYQINTGSI